MKVLPRSVMQTLALASMLVFPSSGIWAQQAPAASESVQAPTGDNAKTNEQDGNSQSLTAEQQKENRADIELTQQVRRAIMRDKSLSTYAHNVKVISQNGTVTLKGPVRSDDEKRAVEVKATEVAGEDNVVNELTVVPDEK